MIRDPRNIVTAESLFAAKRLFESFSDIILAIAPGVDFEYSSFDPYDDSFELYEVPNDFRFTAAQIAAFGAMGFDRCWLNHCNATETRYYKVDGRWGFDRVDIGSKCLARWEVLDAE